MIKFLMLFLFSGVLFAQSFLVEKISGTVKVLRGTSEIWSDVHKGDLLAGNDVVMTESKSFIQFNNDGSRFMLKSDAALGLNRIHKISLNELLLALALEEVRNIPANEGDENIRSTAVYGKNVSVESSAAEDNSEIGIRKLNGAKQLAESGYQKSAIIAAKETFRIYPASRFKIDDRLFFNGLLIDLELYEEALADLNDIQKYISEEKNLQKINTIKTRIKNKIAGK